MRIAINKKWFSLAFVSAAVLLVVNFFVLPELKPFIGKNFYSEAGAAANDNVSGYAWSDNIGWISLNNIPDGGGNNYGINIDPQSGDFSGYAWSDNIGWISFNRSEAGDPPEQPFRGGNGAIAKYHSNTKLITGWARVLAHGDGWDGWIRFCDSNVTNCSAADQVARIDESGKLQGWAWSDVVVGWISLNCSGLGICATVNYGVSTENIANQPPIATDLSAIQPDYCKAGPSATFNWVFSDSDSGNTQSAYQIEIATTPGFAGPSIILDSGKISSASNSYATGSGKLVFDQKYYWRLRVWDNKDLASDWFSGTDFTTPKHAYPAVNFKFSPLNPSAGEVVQFTDLTIAGAAIDNWNWNIPGATYQESTSANSQNPKVIFDSEGTKSIVLTAKDIDGYQCSNTDTASSLQSIKIKQPMPGWKEVSP